jgi:hypothetical protein
MTVAGSAYVVHHETLRLRLEHDGFFKAWPGLSLVIGYETITADTIFFVTAFREHGAPSFALWKSSVGTRFTTPGAADFIVAASDERELVDIAARLVQLRK